ncbi:MAG: hypothetical protein M3R06_11550 [Chloroflexota bacterium]|nr:hypothetical protein [Chloroflexota bacterium]
MSGYAKWGWLIAVAAGSAWIAEAVAIRLSSDGDHWDCNSRWDYGINTLDPIAFGLTALAVVAVHQRQRRRSGRLGAFAAGAAVLGLLAGGINNPIEHCGDIAALGTILWAPAALLTTFGQVLLGIVTIRGRVLPIWAGAILLVGALSPLVAADSGGTIGLGLAWIAVGTALRISKHPDEQIVGVTTA